MRLSHHRLNLLLLAILLITLAARTLMMLVMEKLWLVGGESGGWLQYFDLMALLYFSALVE